MNKYNEYNYATALYEIDSSDKILSQLFTINNAFNDGEIKKFFFAKNIKKAKKKEVIDVLNVDEKIKNLLKILIDEENFNLLNKIVDNYKDKFYFDNKIQEIMIYTAYELSQEQMENIKLKLEKQLGCDVIINYKIDHNLIGGIKIKYNNKLIDNTILKQLEEMKKNIEEFYE